MAAPIRLMCTSCGGTALAVIRLTDPEWVVTECACGHRRDIPTAQLLASQRAALVTSSVMPSAPPVGLPHRPAPAGEERRNVIALDMWRRGVIDDETYTRAVGSPPPTPHRAPSEPTPSPPGTEAQHEDPASPTAVEAAPAPVATENRGGDDGNRSRAGAMKIQRLVDTAADAAWRAWMRTTPRRHAVTRRLLGGV